MGSKDAGKKLFVAGVSWNTTDDGFLNFFARFGAIAESLVMREKGGRSRGFGFVTYKDASVAEKVKSAGQSQQLSLDGHKLDITDAIPRADMISASTTSPKKLYVAGISWDTTDEQLADFFSRFGTVASSQVQRDRATGRSRGFGFVTFEDSGSCEKVLAEQNLSLDGRRLEIKQAVPRGMVGAFDESSRFTSAAPFSGGATTSKPKKIFVAGIADSVSEDELKDHFGSYGRILECYIQKDRTSGQSRGFGFVSFESSEAVEKVLLKPSQKIGDKCVVNIKIARPKGEVGSEPLPVLLSGGVSGGPPRASSVFGYGDWSGPSAYGSSWGGGLPSGYGSGLGGGLGGLGTGASGLGGLGRSSTGYGGVGLGVGSGVGVSGRSDYAPYQTGGYEQSYSGSYSGGGQPSVSSSGGYGESSGLSGYSQWSGASQLEEAQKRAASGYETPYGGSSVGGGYAPTGTSVGNGGGYESGAGQYSYGALQRRTTAPAPAARRGYHPYGR